MADHFPPDRCKNRTDSDGNCPPRIVRLCFERCANAIPRGAKRACYTPGVPNITANAQRVLMVVIRDCCVHGDAGTVMIPNS